MAATGWAKLHRSLLDWAYVSTPNTLVVWIHCLLRATHRPYKTTIGGRPFTLHPGEFKTTQAILAEDTGLTRQQVRTALIHLLSCDCVKINQPVNRQESIITIVNWDKYQSIDDDANQATNQRATNDQPTTNQRPTTLQEFKNKRTEEEDGGVTWTGSAFLVSDNLIGKWEDAWPNLDIRATIRKAEAWYLANPKKRKKNIASFLNNWLSRDGESARHASGCEKHGGIGLDEIRRISGEATND